MVLKPHLNLGSGLPNQYGTSKDAWNAFWFIYQNASTGKLIAVAGGANEELGIVPYTPVW